MKQNKIHYAEFNWSQTLCGIKGANEFFKFHGGDNQYQYGYHKSDKWDEITCKVCLKLRGQKTAMTLNIK